MQASEAMDLLARAEQMSSGVFRAEPPEVLQERVKRFLVSRPGWHHAPFHVRLWIPDRADTKDAEVVIERFLKFHPTTPRTTAQALAEEIIARFTVNAVEVIIDGEGVVLYADWP